MDKKILVVDDEPTIRKNINEYFTEFGFKITEAVDGEDAIIACSKEEFDLVLTDIRMPKMNGLKLLKSLKSLRPELPVVLMTGYDLSKKEIASLQYKADAYVLKPFSLEHIEKIITDLLKIQ